MLVICARMSPLILVVLLALRARWLAGWLTSAAGRAAAPATSSALSSPLNTLRAGSGVSQFFVWFFLIGGVILGVFVLLAMVNYMVGEIKLHRECHRPLRRHSRKRRDWR